MTRKSIATLCIQPNRTKEPLHTAFYLIYRSSGYLGNEPHLLLITITRQPGLPAAFRPAHDGQRCRINHDGQAKYTEENIRNFAGSCLGDTFEMEHRLELVSNGNFGNRKYVQDIYTPVERRQNCLPVQRTYPGHLLQTKRWTHKA